MYSINHSHRKTHVWVLGALVALALFFFLPWEGAAGRTKPAKPKAALVFASTPMDGAASSGKLSPRRGRRNYYGEVEFSMATVRDVYIYTYWKRLRGAHTQTVRIYSPDGHLFQKRIIPFSTRAAAAGTRRRVPGIDNPVDVQQAQAVKGWKVVVMPFPIAGTWVNHHEMRGTWRVEIYHNQAATPSVSGSFLLTE